MNEPEILFETPQLAALNKPAGLVVERDPHGYPSVEEWAAGRWPFAGIVHRLDRPVSGLLVVAKKKSALKALNRQFEVRSVEKVYLAVVENRPDPTSGLLEHWIGKDQKNKRALVFPEASPGAFPAKLDYKLHQSGENGLSLLEVRPQSGKFHQIRVQLAAMGCPIASDEKYGAKSPYQPDGIALHAWKLKLEDPATGEPLHLEAPWPDHPVWNTFSYLASRI